MLLDQSVRRVSLMSENVTLECLNYKSNKLSDFLLLPDGPFIHLLQLSSPGVSSHFVTLVHTLTVEFVWEGEWLQVFF